MYDFETVRIWAKKTPTPHFFEFFASILVEALIFFLIEHSMDIKILQTERNFVRQEEH
jgi:hypothetical protein